MTEERYCVKCKKRAWRCECEEPEFAPFSWSDEKGFDPVCQKAPAVSKDKHHLPDNSGEYCRRCGCELPK